MGVSQHIVQLLRRNGEDARGDHAAPGSGVLYFTRQCTGASATTGAALVNDCKVPPPPPTPPQGTTCPGPQILDFLNDAPNNYPGGSGQNMDNLDIVNASFGSSAGSARGSGRRVRPSSASGKPCGRCASARRPAPASPAHHAAASVVDAAARKIRLTTRCGCAGYARHGYE